MMFDIKHKYVCETVEVTSHGVYKTVLRIRFQAKCPFTFATYGSVNTRIAYFNSRALS